MKYLSQLQGTIKAEWVEDGFPSKPVPLVMGTLLFLFQTVIPSVENKRAPLASEIEEEPSFVLIVVTTVGVGTVGLKSMRAPCPKIQFLAAFCALTAQTDIARITRTSVIFRNIFFSLGTKLVRPETRFSCFSCG